LESDWRGRKAMKTDYDTRRATDLDADAVDELYELGLRSQTDGRDIDREDLVGDIALSDIDLAREVLSAAVIPKRADEFTCATCYLVRHRSQIAGTRGGADVCGDCV